MSADSARRAVVLRIAGERYALPADRVEEVIERVEVAPLAGLPAHAAGVVRHRDAWIPAVDAAPLLGARAAEPPRAAAIVRRGGERYALLAERLCGMLDLAPGSLRESSASGPATRFTLDDEGAILILDPDALFVAAASPQRAEKPRAEPAGAEAVLALRAGGFDLALPVASVLEVRSADGVRPARSRRIAGIVESDGGPLPVVELAARIGAAAGSGDMLVVVAAAGERIALRVDEVPGVTRVPGDHLLPLPPLLAAHARPGLRGLVRDGATLRALLDPAALLAGDARAVGEAARRAARKR